MKFLSAALILGSAAVLIYFAVPGWGWFLLVAFLICGEMLVQ